MSACGRTKKGDAVHGTSRVSPWHSALGGTESGEGLSGETDHILEASSREVRCRLKALHWSRCDAAGKAVTKRRVEVEVFEV